MMARIPRIPRIPRPRLPVLMAALFLLGIVLVPLASAAFTGSVSNTGSRLSAGNVVIGDDAAGAALFTVGTPGTGQVDGSGLRPGQSVANCVKVTYNGTLPAQVHLYVSARTDTAPNGSRLSENLHVSVQEATSGTFGCTGFGGASPLWDGTHPAAQQDWLTGFPTTYATGAPTGPSPWTTGTFRTYKLTFTLDPATPDTAAAATTNVVFRWEAHSAPVNVAANRPATGSSPCASTEAADKAFNGSYTNGRGDKFCSALPAYLQMDLGRTVTLDTFVIRHSGAGGETTDWNLSDYHIDLSTDGSTWTTVVTVTGNTASVTTHSITPTPGRYARLKVSQAGGGAARIYEFEIYGP